MVNQARTPLSVALDSQIGVEGKDIDAFISGRIAGTGSEADTAHGLGRVPSIVIVYAVQKDITTVFDLVEGTHDATNIKVDAETTVTYKIIAF